MDGCVELLVIHEDGRAECIDPACELPERVFHDFRVLCSARDELCAACAAPAARDDRQWRAA
jgi:hypothetical protein